MTPAILLYDLTHVILCCVCCLFRDIMSVQDTPAVNSDAVTKALETYIDNLSQGLIYDKAPGAMKCGTCLLIWVDLNFFSPDMICSSFQSKSKPITQRWPF